MANILVVDDENNIRTMIRLTLERVGHTVETAADGDEGLRKFGDGLGFDLVLLDQRMPGLEGLEVLRQLRYHSPGAKVIMITAFGTIDLAVDAMKAGATDFLRKPFTAETLRGATTVALQGRAGAGSSAPDDRPLTFGMTTLNGFQIVSVPGVGIKMGDEMGFPFTVHRPDGESRRCTVTMSPVVAELVKARVDRERLPGGTRFWQALCEEALANYLWQSAAFPPDDLLRVDELTSGLSRWVDSALTAEA